MENLVYIKSTEVGKATQTFAKAGQAATTAAVVASAVLNTIMSGALAQVWGMINGMQIMIHMPLFKVDIPPDAMLIVE